MIDIKNTVKLILWILYSLKWLFSVFQMLFIHLMAKLNFRWYSMTH